jgi:hypothetical protein
MSNPAIPTDLPCIGCGYNLRGLDLTGSRCPECATEISTSLAAAQARDAQGLTPLEHTHPTWLRRLRRGSTLLLAAIPLHILAVTATLSRHVLPTLCTAGFFASSAVTAVGLWLLSSPEPGVPDRPVRRLTLRLPYLGVIVQRVIGFVLITTGSYATATRLFWVDRVATSAVTWAGLTTLARLAARGHRPRLARTAIVLAWLIPPVTIAQGLFFEMAPVSPNGVWTVLPEPLTGELTAATLLPYSLWTWPRIEWSVAAWTVLSATAVASILVQAAVWRTLGRVKA